VNDFAGGEVLPTLSNQPRVVEALMLRKAKNHLVLVGEYDGRRGAVCPVVVPGVGEACLCVRSSANNTLRPGSDARELRANPRCLTLASLYGVAWAP